MKQTWNKLKVRWQITNDWHIVLILLVFSLAGPSTLVLHRQIDLLLGISDDSNFWVKFIVFIILVLPIYNMFLLIYGTALGQYRFFIGFVKGKINLIKKLFSFFYF